MTSQRPNVLATAALDRVSDRRSDVEWVTAQWAASTTRVHLHWRNTFGVGGDRSISVGPAQLVAHAPGAFQTAILLGLLDDEAHFGLDVSTLDQSAIDALLGPDARLTGLRDAAGVLQADDANMLATTSGLITWHQKHRFCGNCGTETVVQAAGHERKCPNCNAVHFPRTDPAVIMLVTQGERAVLGRQKIWPEGVYSTLAGFVEPGESLEDAVKREVFEEVGLRCDNVRYSSSQPWPFPQSLMLGFHATAVTSEIVVHPTEMDDAQWFSAEQLLESRTLGRKGWPIVPPPMTIARRLLDEWLDTVS
jgi:NAD+ diphosphatase